MEKINLSVIKERISQNYYENKLEYPSFKTHSKLKEDYVFNENLSVKKNKEMVIEHNNKIDQLKKKYKDETIKLEELFYNELILALKNEYNFNEKICQKIYSKSYKDNHSYGKLEVLNDIEELSDFVYEILNIRKE